MTIVNKLGLCLFALISALFIYLYVVFQMATEQTETPDKDYISFDYVITEVNSIGYHGTSEDGTGIYFNDTNLQPDQVVIEGDRVRVFFEKSNVVDGIQKVELIEK